MIIVMRRQAEQKLIDHVIQEMITQGLKPVPLIGTERTVIAVIGDERILDIHHLRSLPGVSDVHPILKPYKLASRETKYENTVIEVNGVRIGSEEIAIMAGPCAVENEDQVEKTASSIKKSGAKILRGGAFKPRTGPYSFEGLGKDGLKILRAAADRHGLAVITELMDIRDIDLIMEYADIIQIGARNMQNFTLLNEVGSVKKPILLKRGLSSTVTELLLAAERIMAKGNLEIMLCERGIRTFEQETRNTFGLNSIPLIKELSHLPIIADPSHATGKRTLVPPMARAAIAAGADGLIIEVHPQPDEALCDGDQSITTDTFEQLVKEIAVIAPAVRRKFTIKS
ncbi:3-deoxy-7-phosphoheptulonate synthase [Candidatus Peregrinibacteria bacterium]|nr:3-deoxy-7-phosphoheptulonate synthase [Candidatus Peregrinibacteria bacterium]